ncbi:MAG: acylneuraminate cytidylyltransferase [Pseudomonadota bacterium]
MGRESRRLVAALACRNNGSRLYGKPLQNLIGETTILDQIIAAIRKFPIIEQIVLGISEGAANLNFVDFAHEREVSYVFGDPRDVLHRLILCGRLACATDVFRVTTECPWFAYDLLESAWRQHVTNANDITVCDRLPEGMHFEIYRLAALEESHERGSSKDRSEFCSNYARTHPDEFKIQVLQPPHDLQRMDLRVTVDYPEDLILCREIAKAHADSMPLVELREIVEFLDSRPDLKALVAPFVVPEPVWDVVQ